MTEGTFPFKIRRDRRCVRCHDPDSPSPPLQFVPGFEQKILPAAKQHQICPSSGRPLLWAVARISV